MAIPLYACLADGNDIITLDDEAVVKDLAAENGTGGSSFESYLVSAPFDHDLDAGYSKFRRSTQHVHTTGAVDVEVTPYRDGNPTGQTITRSLTTGANPVVIAPLSSLATTHQVEIRLSSFTAPVEIGKSQQYVVPRRTER